MAEPTEAGPLHVSHMYIPDQKTNSASSICGKSQFLVMAVMLLSYLSGINNKLSVVSVQVVSRLTDGSRFQEFKARYGTTLITGFAKIHG